MNGTCTASTAVETCALSTKIAHIDAKKHTYIVKAPAYIYIHLVGRHKEVTASRQIVFIFRRFFTKKVTLQIHSQWAAETGENEASDKKSKCSQSKCSSKHTDRPFFTTN